MAAIPDPKGQGVLTGNALTAWIANQVQSVRATADVPVKNEIPKNANGAAAVRILGKSLMGIVPQARDFLNSTFSTGAFSGLGFTVADYDLAITRVSDSKGVDAAIAQLSKDAHGEATFAVQNLAEMTLQIIKTYIGVLAMPSSSPQIKAAFKTAGGLIAAAVATIKLGRKKSRKKNAASKEKDNTITTLEQTVQQFQANAAVQQAQDKLKLQELTGEPLRAKDVVVVDSPPVTAATAAAAGKKDGKQVSAVAPASPAAEKTRRASR
jgi:hypothetical protein